MPALSLLLRSSFVAVPAVRAQDVTEDQIKAARATIAALRRDQQLRQHSAETRERLKNTLIQASPNHQELITATVDEKALSLAGRRSDLERSRHHLREDFTVEELNAIADFYKLDRGPRSF